MKVKEYPSLLIRGMGLVNSVMRDLPEVAYQFEEPFMPDFTAAQTTFDLAPTPWDDMLAGTIDKYTD